MVLSTVKSGAFVPTLIILLPPSNTVEVSLRLPLGPLVSVERHLRKVSYTVLFH
jgi:hypothetical protein